MHSSVTKKFKGKIIACDPPNLTLNLFKLKENNKFWSIFHFNNKSPSQHLGELDDNFYPSLLRNGLDNWPLVLEKVGTGVHIKTQVCSHTAPSLRYLMYHKAQTSFLKDIFWGDKSTKNCYMNLFINAIF